MQFILQTPAVIVSIILVHLPKIIQNISLEHEIELNVDLQLVIEKRIVVTLAI